MQVFRRSWINIFICSGAVLGAAILAGCSTGDADAANGGSPEANAQPTAADVKEATRQIAPLLNRSNVTVRVVSGNGSGSGSADLNGGFQNAMLARINPDGTVSQECVDSEEQATSFFSAPLLTFPRLKLPLQRKE